ncbi:hypothetical protein [Streptomyces sp. 142MFCol3.1]|uniref:hypothetical protein n=1 Tax=Streptomyces sp. 142MFCol3.1 TaxID=1172179 RepID=UPI000491F39C|nr:hypothetical protein [Streptomyces sp. 142MFCol3.1]
MPNDLTPVIAASTRWLLNAYPSASGALSQALAEAQAGQAVTLAASLLYPTSIDVELLHLLAPSGSHRLDRLIGCIPPQDDEAWRTWADETVVSWAACLLADPALAKLAREALNETEHHKSAGPMQRLTDPSGRDSEAAVLLRHPDLVEAVADLHRPQLMKLLTVDGAGLR